MSQKQNSLISNLNNKTVASQEEVTLEKVLKEMATAFQDLNYGIKLINSSPKEASVYSIENELEKVYKKQEKNTKLKQEQARKKAESLTSNRNSPKQPKSKPAISQSRPSSASSQRKTNVTNLKFPRENLDNLNAQTTTAKSSPKAGSNAVVIPCLRKPLKNNVSSPPSREIYNPLGIIKDEVDRAIRDSKTFTIRGEFPAVRRALLKRGWIEKFHPRFKERAKSDVRHLHYLSIVELVDLLKIKNTVDPVKKIIKSKLLRDHQVDLYWDHTFDVFKECPDNKKLTLINRFRRESFSYTSKQGLCQAARDAYWLQIPGVAKINHPRCYVLAKGGDTKAFLKDFGLTAAISLLKWVIKNNITGECKIISETGKIPIKFFDFAITECYKYLKRQKHLDIDEEIPEALEVEWNEFLDQYYKAVHIGNHFKLTSKNVNIEQETKQMIRKANYLLNQIREHMSSLDMDGYMNIWILKPINSSRGIGIHICRTLQYILDTIKRNPNTRYVIQKYIERPLLIHETKFDIRQWFLVSSSYPLTIWIYKLCYLRFSSQTYNLRKLHEAIHLTNNSVQAKYLQFKSRDPLLSSYGMWDSHQFKNYLSDIGYPTIFETVIYPGMKQSITGAMMAHRDKIDKRKNCFELYGADFILTENFEPWLLEINSNPALHASTPVTAKLCPEVLEDVIKVVVDNARNPRADTGHFELIYKEKLEKHFTKSEQKLLLTGMPLSDDYFYDVAPIETPNTVVTGKTFQTPDPGKLLLQTRETMKETLKQFLAIVKKEKQKRRSRREKSIEAKIGDDNTSQVISLFQSTIISKTSSGHSIKLTDIEDVEELPFEPPEIKSIDFQEQNLSNLINVMDGNLEAIQQNAQCKR